MYRSEIGQETYPTNPVMRIKSQRKNTPMQSSMDSGCVLASSDTPTCSPPLSWKSVLISLQVLGDSITDSIWIDRTPEEFTGWPKWTWKTSCWLSSGTFGSCWAATVATYCPGRITEHPKFNSTGGFLRPLEPPCMWANLIFQNVISPDSFILDIIWLIRPYQGVKRWNPSPFQ